jgi:hypothetical protein
MKVFLGLGDICGYYSQLERGFKEIGVACMLVNAYPDRQYERVSRPGPLGRLTEWVAARRVGAARGSITRLVWSAAQGVSLVLLLLSSLATFDVFIFSGGTSFLFLRDLWLLKLFRKKIIVVFHGSDSRPPYLNAAAVGTEGAFDVHSCVRETRAVKRKLRTIERYADFVVNHSMNSHFHERAVINWLQMGIPCDATSRLKQGFSGNGHTAVILHAPTRPGPKGTARIEEAILSLQGKGYDIRFVKLVDQPHSEVLRLLSECDFVVDELFSDTTMASFATEAAVLGKPAIVGMYGFDKLRSYTPSEMVPPTLVCRPDDVECAIEKLVVDQDYRDALGAQARRFVEQKWNAASVARRFVHLASGEIPHDWWFDPKTLDYLHGWGLTDRRAREVVRVCVATGGMSALCIADKPRLERAFSAFAQGTIGPDQSQADSKAEIGHPQAV